MSNYIYHQDPSHGWVEVPMAELRALGIAGRISPWSYRDGETAYLEEDDDASLFLDTMRARGTPAELVVLRHEYSPVRNYLPYRAG